MRMTKLNQFFRDAGAAISRSPEVRQAVRQAVKQVELKIAAQVGARFADGFEAPRANKAPAAATSDTASNGDFVKGLYRDLLGREPDIGGFNAHMAGLARGASRDDIRNVFLGSSELAEKQAAAAAGPSEPVAPAAPAAPQNNFGDAKNLGRVPLEGFDSGKLANPDHKSVKYLFGRVATHFGLESEQRAGGSWRCPPESPRCRRRPTTSRGSRLQRHGPRRWPPYPAASSSGAGHP